MNNGERDGLNAEIATLEAKLSKARDVKAGMMSVLVTGKIRLVESGKWIVESGKCGMDGEVTALGGKLSRAREVKAGRM